VWKDKGTVIVDAGHGGFDGGAESEGKKHYEKDINLKIAKTLEQSLLKLGYQVVMTRETDTALGKTKREDTRARVLIQNDYPNALYVSVHCNKFEDPQYGGLQVFFPKNSEQSHMLADEIQKSVKEQVLQDNDRVAQSGSRSIYLLNATKLTTVIVECGFLSNSRDLALLTDESHQVSLAEAISTGVDSYMKNKESEGKNSIGG
jgi:N-acetylmuramoyl-L-alanine amidase